MLLPIVWPLDLYLLPPSISILCAVHPLTSILPGSPALALFIADRDGICGRSVKKLGHLFGCLDSGKEKLLTCLGMQDASLASR